MHHGVRLLVVSSLCLLAGACHTASPAQRAANEQGALMQREIAPDGYRQVYSAYNGKVGFMKMYHVQEAGGPVYQWQYVYDLAHKELGFIDQFGVAYRYHYYPEQEQRIHKRPHRTERMAPDSAERNVMRMLGIDPAADEVTFPVATRADIMTQG
jgi:hypothetical protein